MKIWYTGKKKYVVTRYCTRAWQTAFPRERLHLRVLEDIGGGKGGVCCDSKARPQCKLGATC